MWNKEGNNYTYNTVNVSQYSIMKGGLNKAYYVTEFVSPISVVRRKFSGREGATKSCSEQSWPSIFTQEATMEAHSEFALVLKQIIN